MKIKNYFLHFKKILIHKKYVRKYCFKVKLYKQGLLHDVSKFNPIEFFESVKYYQGNSSPIDACKKDIGYSNAWLHHKGCNKHHYEYWVDNLDNGGEALLMPFEYALELVCDYLGAGQAYMGKDFTYLKEYEWWTKKKEKNLLMHPAIITFIDLCLLDLVYDIRCLNKEHFKDNYNQAIQHWKNEQKKENNDINIIS